MRGICSIPPVAGRCRALSSGAALDLLLELCSPLHDDGALISSHLDLEPQPGGPDPEDTLCPPERSAADGDLPPRWEDLDPSGAEAEAAVAAPAPSGNASRFPALARPCPSGSGLLWPVADTWQAAERTFRSALALMRRWPELRFAHSTPAFTPGWNFIVLPCLPRSRRPAAYFRNRSMDPGEADCVLVNAASLWNRLQSVRTTAGAAFRNGP